REFPKFAPRTLRDWFVSRPGRPATGKKIILWADTFNNHFHPEVGVAAVEALETAGYHVVIPRAHLCCGRPLYDYGMLDLARRYLERVLGTLRDEIRAGTPIVGIEPSCIAVLKDEAPKLMPNDEDVKRLCKQSFHLAEFLCRDGYEPPRLEGRALVHGHCHEKATSGFEPLQELLQKMGLDVETSNGGCCGMAGAWGYEKGHYDVSIACGERALFPAVRRGDDDVLVITDGFSCKTQIEQGTGRRALHLAEVLQLAHGRATQAPQAKATTRAARAGALVAGAAVVAGGVLAFRER
ncbi:MAG: (Fe-S)-binding protein, partial [Gaiellaceae bacterium]